MANALIETIFNRKNQVFNSGSLAFCDKGRMILDVAELSHCIQASPANPRTAKVQRILDSMGLNDDSSKSFVDALIGHISNPPFRANQRARFRFIDLFAGIGGAE